MIYDLIIIGMGPAGVSAGLYAKQSGLHVLCFDKNVVGGLVNNISKVNNYAGHKSAIGSELAFDMYLQLKENNIEVINKEAQSICKKDDVFVVDAGEKYSSKNIIIATGRKANKLGLDGEDELIGHGISFCGICDGSLYKNQTIAVVGGANSAVTETIELAKICKKIYLIYRNGHLRADKAFVDKLEQLDNVEIIYNSNITNLVKDDGHLAKIIVNDDYEIEVAGLFEFIGYNPYYPKLDNISIQTNNNYIVVNDKYETSELGLYAVGDIIDKDIYQIVTAISDGAKAAIYISRK